MFDRLLALYLSGKIDAFRLDLSVQKGFITEAQKDEIINYGK